MGIPFFSLFNADIRVAGKDFVWWSYILQRPCLLVASRRVNFVDKECAANAVDQAYKLVSGMACTNAEPPDLPHEFRDFANLFAPNSATEFSSSQQSVYGISLSQPC